MTREQRLKSCSICKNRKPNLERGLLCGLTNEYASFEGECSSFELDEYAERAQRPALLRAQKEEELRNQRRDFQQNLAMRKAIATEKNNPAMSGASWFMWIFFLSLVNTIIIAFGGSWNFMFGLGMTSIWEQVYINFVGPLDALAITVSVLISSVFLPIGIYARKLSKTAFIIGIILYGIDTLLMLVLMAWIPVAIHGVVIYYLIRGYRHIDQVKPKAIQLDEDILDNDSA